MNRGKLREKILDLRSWHADVDDDFVAEVNRSVIEVALKRLASEVPEAFVPDQETLFFLNDEDQDSLSRTVSATVDPYVLDLGLVGSSENIVTDGTWDGVYHLEIPDTANPSVMHRRQCREFWRSDENAEADQHYYVSVERPFTDAAAQVGTGADFRLHQPYVYTRDDVTRVVDGRLYTDSRALVDILPAGFARFAFLEEYKGQSLGPPQAISRWGRFQIAAPNRAPTAALDGDIAPDPWVGPMPPGSRKYRYTYVWGKRDAEAVAPGGGYDPMWESSPSPESAAVDVANMSAAVKLTNLTNIDFLLNFYPDPATLRNGRSGLRKRIYVAISSVEAGAGTVQEIEYPDIYFFLDEVDGSITTYTDDGSVVPDYFRRLPESHGYYSWAAHPHPDSTYQMDIRVYRRPLSLLVDSDAPQIDPEFEDMLLLLCLRYLSDLDKQPEDALNYENQYKARVEQYRAQKTNPADYVPATPWTPTSAQEWRYRDVYGRFSNS